MFECTGCGMMLAADHYRHRSSGYREKKCRGCERAYMRQRYTDDPDLIRKRKRESMARKRAADPQAARDYRNDYHARNRDKRTAKMREYYARRFFWGRAMKLRGKGRANAADLSRLWRHQRGLCALTGRRLTRHNAHLDHITAKARGGSDEAANLRWLCTEANLALRELSDAEFLSLCSDVMSWIGERIAKVEELSHAERQAA